MEEGQKKNPPFDHSVQEKFFVYPTENEDFFLSALHITYPMIWKIIGEGCATKVANNFKAAYETEDLSFFDWAKNFPNFLEEDQDLKNFIYLGDVARLEWLQYQSFLAPRSAALDSRHFHFSPEEIEILCFQPHPSLFFFASPYPLEKIWHLNIDAHQVVNVSEGCSWALVVRPQNMIEIYWLTGEEYTFLESLAEGYSLRTSAEKVLSIANTFDFFHVLYLAFKKGFFVSVYTPLSCGIEKK